MIKRSIAPYLKRMAGSFPVVSVVGPRQSGKTTLARMLFPDREYLNLENPETMREAVEDGADFFRNHPPPLLLDEIQRVPELFSRIQVFVDAHPSEKGLFILTGSQQPDLKDGLSQSLAGRVALVTLLPFSAAELSAAGKLPPRDEALFRGFMPRLHQEDVRPFDLYENYLATYVERDVNRLVNVRDRRAFSAFLRVLAGRTGQLVNCESIAGDVGVSMPTVKHWISVLEACFVVFTLPCYYRNFGKRFVKTPKIYFTEVGLAAHLLGIRAPEQVSRDPLFGSLFENMVVAEAFKARLNRGLPPDLYFIRDRTGTEVDLVLEEARRLHLFEIKAASGRSQDFAKNLGKVASFADSVAGKTVLYSGPDLPHAREAAFANWTNTDALVAAISGAV